MRRSIPISLSFLLVIGMVCSAFCVSRAAAKQTAAHSCCQKNDKKTDCGHELRVSKSSPAMAVAQFVPAVAALAFTPRVDLVLITRTAAFTASAGRPFHLQRSTVLRI